MASSLDHPGLDPTGAVRDPVGGDPFQSATPQFALVAAHAERKRESGKGVTSEWRCRMGDKDLRQCGPEQLGAGLVARFGQQVVRFRATFHGTWFHPAGSIADEVRGQVLQFNFHQPGGEGFAV